MPKDYKKMLLGDLAVDAEIQKTLAAAGAVGDLAKSLDANSASVPVLFLGSCKVGSVPYDVGYACDVLIDGRMRAKKIAVDAAGYNLVAELSLASSAAYPDRVPLLAKRAYPVRPAVLAEARIQRERRVGGPADDGLAATDDDLSVLTIQNPDARYLKELLALLPAEYCEDRNRWRDVVYALANTGDSYYPLAVWFSQRRPRAWTGAEGTADRLETLWAEARRCARPDALTARSIAWWASQADPRGYRAVCERSYLSILMRYVYTNGGRIEHAMAADVLHRMLGSKYCTDTVGDNPAHPFRWYEFVTADQAMRPGEVWKWRAEVIPETLILYISKKLPIAYNFVMRDLEDRAGGAAEETEKKYLNTIITKFKASLSNLANDIYIGHVVRCASLRFHVRGFAERLDRVPGILGVYNGVLRLGAKCELIAAPHGYPISRFTPVFWRPFDEDDHMTQIALGAIADIIPEPDVRDWILYHAAQGLSWEAKEGLFLIWTGIGQNGKSSFLQWIAKALGPYADKFNIQLMACEREDANQPNSAVMKFKYMNWGYSEETNKAQTLNTARLKELVSPGAVSGRELHSRQETFDLHCNIVAASQHQFRIEATDHGTWRRIRRYTSKTRFCPAPKATDPFEKKDDQRYVKEYPNNPDFQTAILSILTHYYERLQTEHMGYLKNVSCPTLENETDMYQSEQNKVHVWVREVVVRSPGYGTEYTMDFLVAHFTDWYRAKTGRDYPYRDDAARQIAESRLSTVLATEKEIVKARGIRIHDYWTNEPPVFTGTEEMFNPAVPAPPARNTFPENATKWWRCQAPAARVAMVSPCRPPRLDLSASAARDGSPEHAFRVVSPTARQTRAAARSRAAAAPASRATSPGAPGATSPSSAEILQMLIQNSESQQ
jgi:hypothetical protein